MIHDSGHEHTPIRWVGQHKPGEGRTPTWSHVSSTHELGWARSANLSRGKVIPLPIHEEERDHKRCLDLKEMFGDNKFLCVDSDCKWRFPNKERKEKFFPPRGQSGIEEGSPHRLCSLHLWRFSRQAWLKPWVTLSHLRAEPAFSSRLDYTAPEFPSTRNYPDYKILSLCLVFPYNLVM